MSRSDDRTEADLDFLLGRRGRADAMAERLRRTAGWHGLDRDDANRLGDLFLLAMRRRAPAIADDHHPDFLHPARTALILLDDVGVRNAAVLQAAVLQDTARPDHAMTPDEVERSAGADVARIIARLPSPGADPRDIIETLVTLPPDVLALYLAARLDHARHIHLRGDPAEWQTTHDQVTEALTPLAHRRNALLAKRFERWARAFRKRFLGQTPPSRQTPDDPAR